MHFVFIMDPTQTVIYDEDTSFALMMEAQKRGHRVDHMLMAQLSLKDGRVHGTVRAATMRNDPSVPITLGATETLWLHDVDAVFVRTDPPFDSGYLWGTLLLDRLAEDALVVNNPTGLRQANEKLYACHFPEFTPDTLVSSDKGQIRDFVATVGGKAVIKPLGGAGGEGVMALTAGDQNFNAIVEMQTHNSKQLTMVQRYLPEVQEGDKRILVLDGEPLGAILRVPQGGDVRSNIHVGGIVEEAAITDGDRTIIEALVPRLRDDGLYFVGLDVIGGKLTEVNVTSPTGIQQMERLDGVNYSERVIEWTEARCSA